MIRLLIPVVLLGAAGALFFLYTNTTYQRIKALSVEVREYDAALEQSRELQELRNRLLSKYNTFSPVDVRKLERLLPDHVDNIRLIIDIDNIASRYNMRVRNVSLRDTQDSRQQRSALAVGAGGDPIGSVELGFTVSATYEDYLRFLQDLERSLRIVDVNSVSIKIGEGELYEYGLVIRTYWLH